MTRYKKYIFIGFCIFAIECLIALLCSGIFFHGNNDSAYNDVAGYHIISKY